VLCCVVSFVQTQRALLCAVFCRGFRFVRRMKNGVYFCVFCPLLRREKHGVKREKKQAVFIHLDVLSKASVQGSAFRVQR